MVDLIKLLTDIASGAFTGPISRERAKLFKQQLELRDETIRTLERKLADEVKKRTASDNRAYAAEEQLAAVLVTEDHLEHAGVLWKRLDGGGYSPQPVCPMCRAPLSVIMPNFGMRCAPCKFITTFKASERIHVHAEIPS